VKKVINRCQWLVVSSQLQDSNFRSSTKNQELRTKNAFLAIHLDTRDTVYPITVDPIIYGSEIKLTASDGAASDRFGNSVSVNGDVAIVGAIWDDDQGDLSGSAYIFERNADGTNAWARFQN